MEPGAAGCGVNGSRARFYRLQFVNEKTRTPLVFTQIGAEGGLVRAPVSIDRPPDRPGVSAPT